MSFNVIVYDVHKDERLDTYSMESTEELCGIRATQFDLIHELFKNLLEILFDLGFFARTFCAQDMVTEKGGCVALEVALEWAILVVELLVKHILSPVEKRPKSDLVRDVAL